MGEIGLAESRTTSRNTGIGDGGQKNSIAVIFHFFDSALRNSYMLHDDATNQTTYLQTVLAPNFSCWIDKSSRSNPLTLV